MEAHVIVATKGRARELCRLLDHLADQTLAPASVTLVGVDEADVEGVSVHSYSSKGKLQIVLSRTAGSCLQRNMGIDHLLCANRPDQDAPSFFVTFFDDDFRPARDWLEKCGSAFSSQPEVAAVTGCVLADGVHGAGLTDAQAAAYIDGQVEPVRHWASGAEQRDLDAMYGCNMAVRDRAIVKCRFDERLALYGWQEDQDYTSQVRTYGRTIYLPDCRGVHLGIRSGRTSGLRFGYSQMANPVYLARKGTMPARKSARFVVRHLLANSARSLRFNPLVDYRGRLRGNLLAIADMLRGRCDPRRVLELP